MKKSGARVIYYNFCGNIYNDDPGISDLINFINENDGDYLKVGFCSGGGDQGLSRFIAHVLNENKKRIEIVVYNFAGSAAFEILYLFEGKITITWGTSGMIHYGSVTVEVDDREEIFFHRDRSNLKNARYQKTWRDEMAAEVLTPAQLKRFKRGKDVYMDYEQMKKIFEK
jgi:hypothetical protein